MNQYRPYTQQLKDRIELLLAESINQVDIEHIDLYITQTTNKLLELFYDEFTHYGRHKWD